MARREQRPRRFRRTAARDAIGVSGQQCPPQPGVADVLLRPLAGERLQHVRDPDDVRRQIPLALNRAEQIAGRRRARHNGRRRASFGEERAGERGPARAAGRDEDRGQARADRKALDAAAAIGEPAVLHQLELLEQRDGGVDSIHRRRLEPRERARVAAPGHDVEHRPRQIDAMNLRLAVRPQSIGPVPQAQRQAGTKPAGAAGALIGRVLGNAFGLEAVHGAVGVVARDLLQPDVDDRGDARHRQRGLGDVGREDDAATARGFEGAVLRARVERAVKLDDFDRLGRCRQRGRDVTGGTVDLRRAREKAQHVAGGLVERGAYRRCRRRAGLVSHVDGMQRPGHVDYRTTVEECGNARGVDRRRHHQQPQIVARRPRLSRQRDAEVGVDAALVELVEDDGTERRQQRILLQPRGQDAFSGEEDAGLWTELTLEANVPSDLAANRPTALVSDAARQTARRDPSRLQHDHRAVVGNRRRHAGRLTRRRRRRHDSRACDRQGVDNARQMGVDGEGVHRGGV